MFTSRIILFIRKQRFSSVLVIVRTEGLFFGSKKKLKRFSYLKFILVWYLNLKAFNLYPSLLLYIRSPRGIIN